MHFLFWLCFSFMTLGLLVRIPIGGAGILLTDIFTPLLAFIWIFYKIVKQEIFPQNNYILSGFLFLVVALISFFLGAWDLLLKEQIIAFSYILRFFSLLIFGWIAQDFFQQNSASFWQNFWKILWIILSIGFLQFFVLPDISKFSTVGGFDPHIGRFLGTWMDPNFVAGLLTFSLPILIAFIYKKYTTYKQTDLKLEKIKNSRNFRFLGLIILLGLSFLALFLTFSRSGYLAVIIGLGLFFLIRDTKIILIGLLIGILGLISNERASKRVLELVGTIKSIVLQETDEVDATASLRIISWQKSFELYKKYPIFGIGYNTYRYHAAEEGIVDENYFSAGGSDSTFLTILVTTGTLGGLFFIYFCGKLFFRNLIFYLKNRQDKYILHLGFSAGFLGIFVHSFFVNSLLFPLIFMPIMAIAGILEKRGS